MADYSAVAVLDRMPDKATADVSKGALYLAIVRAFEDPDNDGKVLRFNAQRIGTKTATALLEVGIFARTINGNVHARQTDHDAA